MTDIVDDLRSLSLSLATKSSLAPPLIEGAITEILSLRNRNKHLQEHISQCHGHDVDFMNSLINGD